ncbi:MAG: tyrosine-type recombinase/integrase [Salinibacterium sp.]|nr:tyrosine-type recombinase/integrase [Salinibacterium sp.]
MRAWPVRPPCGRLTDLSEYRTILYVSRKGQSRAQNRASDPLDTFSISAASTPLFPVSAPHGDLDAERGALLVREGKGQKDRLVPIGERALLWTAHYLDRVRSLLRCRALRTPEQHALFLSARGHRIRATKLTDRLHQYVGRAGIAKPGSVHIFRHTMATLMHDAGADIRDLQEMLGHAQLSTTEIYTHVSIERLKAVHTKTHPAHLTHPTVDRSARAPFLLAAAEPKQ